MFLPDVGWKVADHVDIRDDKVVSQQEMAQQVLLLTGVAEQLLTEQAAHVLPSGNPNNDFCQQHDTTLKDTSQTKALVLVVSAVLLNLNLSQPLAVERTLQPS